MLEIDVDIRRLLALRRDETLEEQVVFCRIDLSDAEAETHARIRRRAPPLGEDPPGAGKAHDIVHGEKVRRIAELPDQGELVPQRGLHLVGNGFAEAFPRALAGKMFERFLRRIESGAGFLRIFVAQIIKGEAEPVHEAARLGNRFRHGMKQPRHLRWRLQMTLPIGLEPLPRRIEGDAKTDTADHILQRAAVPARDRAHLPRRISGSPCACASACRAAML